MSRTDALSSARTMVSAFLAEDTDLVRQSAQSLSEAVGRGAALSLSALVGRHSARPPAAWAVRYTEQERNIRAALRGSLGEIEASAPRTRFRVLTSPHAPANPERFLPKVEASLREVLAQYEQVAARADVVRARPMGNLPIEESALATMVLRFCDSLAEDARASAAVCASVLAEFGAQAMPEIVRMHDALADALIDFKVALAYTERALPGHGQE